MRIRWAVVCAVVCCLCASSVQALDVASLKPKAESGDAKAQIALAQAYEKGDGVPQNNDLAAKWMRAAAEQGNAQAQSELGVFYSRGIGVEQDKAQAVEWYRKAARQGYAPAMFNIGTAYYNGDGVTTNDELAYTWFALASLGGSKEAADAIPRMEAQLSESRLVLAKLAMSSMLDAGVEVPGNPAKGFEIAKGVADTGNTLAQIHLAQMYLEGRGVDRNPVAARDLCQSAAKRKYAPAQFCMGFISEKGEIGAPDDKLAAEWYSKAADAGDRQAMYRLGRMYREGRGVKKDPIKAYVYLWYAVGGGDPAATQEYESLKAELPDHMLKRAEEKAREWRRQHF